MSTEMASYYQSKKNIKMRKNNKIVIESITSWATQKTLRKRQLEITAYTIKQCSV